MLNSYSQSIQNKNIVSTHINAVTGQISKTYTKSFFKTFSLNGNIADDLFGEKPQMVLGREWVTGYAGNGRWSDITKDVVVIQMVICGDLRVIAEIMLKEDYDEVLLC